MTVEELLRKYQTPTDPRDAGSVEDLECYGVIRAHRERAVMLELRKSDGSVFAFPYAMIEQILYTPSDGITIRAVGREIRITGSNLNLDVRPRVGLLNGLLRHRIAWIEECSIEPPHESGPSVRSLEW